MCVCTSPCVCACVCVCFCVVTAFNGNVYRAAQQPHPHHFRTHAAGADPSKQPTPPGTAAGIAVGSGSGSGSGGTPASSAVGVEGPGRRPSRLGTVTNVDCAPMMCNTAVNTYRHRMFSRGCTHVEGGWGEGIDSSDLQQTARYRRKVQRQPELVRSLTHAAAVASTCVRQNATVNLFEEYFAGDQHTGLGSDANPAVHDVTVLTDPSPIKRACVGVSWQSPSSNRLATAHCNGAVGRSATAGNTPAAVESAGEQLQSYVWDIERASAPVQELLPKSPLCTLVFNHTHPDVLLGGTFAGMVALFDLRAGPHPTSSSYLEYGHTEPVTSAVWTRQRAGMEVVTVSTDRQVCWWDARRLSEPVLRQPLVIPRHSCPPVAFAAADDADDPVAAIHGAGTSARSPSYRQHLRRRDHTRRRLSVRGPMTPSSVVAQSIVGGDMSVLGGGGLGAGTAVGGPASLWGTRRTSTVLPSGRSVPSHGGGTVVGGLCIAQGLGVGGMPMLLVSTEHGAIVSPGHPSVIGGSDTAAGAMAAAAAVAAAAVANSTAGSDTLRSAGVGAGGGGGSDPRLPPSSRRGGALSGDGTRSRAGAGSYRSGGGGGGGGSGSGGGGDRRRRASVSTVGSVGTGVSEGGGLLRNPEVFTGHAGPVPAVHMHPLLPGFFVTAGEWCTRLWSTDLTRPILSPGPRAALLTGAQWSPTRAGVWLSTRTDGVLDVWDLLQSQTRPTLEEQVSNEALAAVGIHPQGQLLAVGDVGGSIHVATLSNSLCAAQPSEAASVQAVLDRLAAVAAADEEHAWLDAAWPPPSAVAPPSAGTSPAVFRFPDAQGDEAGAFGDAPVTNMCARVREQLASQMDGNDRAPAPA